MAKTFILAPEHEMAVKYVSAIGNRVPTLKKALVMVPNEKNVEQLIKILQVSRKSIVHIIDAPSFAEIDPEGFQRYMKLYDFARSHNPYRIVKYNVRRNQ